MQRPSTSAADTSTSLGDTAPVSDEIPVAARRRLLPRRFGRYLLFDAIGKGGMAEIYLARAENSLGGARLCVVKQILPDFSEHPSFAEMLIREAKLAARLSHANVVQVFDLGREGSDLYIAMEYVEGFDLNALLRRCARAQIPLPVEFALLIVHGALRGLDYAHRRVSDDGTPLGIVHRDISPSNVLISFDGEVKLCDFGIAHAAELLCDETSASGAALKGKAGYMSPEHARGDAVDARSDVFAVGIVLWELLSGRRMYRPEEGKPGVIEQARRAEPPPVTVRGIDHEPQLHALLNKALAPAGADRYASAACMLRDLDAFMRDARLVVSSLRFGEWLVDNFGADVLLQRRARERDAEAILGPYPTDFAQHAAAREPEPAVTSSSARVVAEPEAHVEMGPPVLPPRLAGTTLRKAFVCALVGLLAFVAAVSTLMRLWAR